MEISTLEVQMDVNPSASIHQGKSQIAFQKSKLYMIYYCFIAFKMLSVFHMYLCN